LVEPDAPWILRIESLTGIANLERESGNASQSVALWTEAIELAQSHQSTRYEGVCLRGLGEAWMEQNNVVRALPLLRRSVYLLRSAREDPAGFQVANSERALAQAYLMDGDAVRGEEEIVRALELMTKTGSAAHPQAAAMFDIL